MGKRRKKSKSKIPLIRSTISQSQKENWKTSEEDKRMFLEAVETLENVQDDLTVQKFDLMEDKSFKVRRKKSSFREVGEQIKESLDLHGFCREEAITRLAGFCHQSSGQGFRTVLVITGKGIHSEDLKPALKKEVIHWLNSKRGRQLVEFYRSGSRPEGGEGALILYLYRA